MAIGFAIIFLSVIPLGLILEKIGLENPVIGCLIVLPVAMFGDLP
jgi:hypothetical protein